MVLVSLTRCKNVKIRENKSQILTYSQNWYCGHIWQVTVLLWTRFRCYIEQDTSPSLLSSCWFQERIQEWFHNRTKLNWWPYGILRLIKSNRNLDSLVKYHQNQTSLRPSLSLFGAVWTEHNRSYSNVCSGMNIVLFFLYLHIYSFLIMITWIQSMRMSVGQKIRFRLSQCPMKFSIEKYKL